MRLETDSGLAVGTFHTGHTYSTLADVAGAHLSSLPPFFSILRYLNKQGNYHSGNRVPSSMLLAAFLPVEGSLLFAGSRAFVAVHTARRALSARAAEATASEQTSEIAASLERVRADVAAAATAAGRAPDAVELVAVSKTKPVELLRAAYDAGQRVFGEVRRNN